MSLRSSGSISASHLAANSSACRSGSISLRGFGGGGRREIRTERWGGLIMVMRGKRAVMHGHTCCALYPGSGGLPVAIIRPLSPVYSGVSLNSLPKRASQGPDGDGDVVCTATVTDRNKIRATRMCTKGGYIRVVGMNDNMYLLFLLLGQWVMSRRCQVRPK